MLLAAVGLTLTLPAISQAQTLARLNREASPDIPHTTETIPNGTRAGRVQHPAPLPESALSRAAARALFVDSMLDSARRLAMQALRHDPQDAEALFVRMEVAGMEADYAAVLDSALRLCAVGADAPGDVRVRLAAVRLRESAANTPEFRAAIPRIQQVLANAQGSWPDLHAALLKAAMDGAPGLDPYAVARAAGILTDWRILGPLGRHALLDFDQQQISAADDLAQPSYQNHVVEKFRFPDGEITLPDYLSHRGMFYAAARFASLVPGNWTADMEGAGPLELYVDGRLVFRSEGSRGHRSAVFEATPGPHHVLMKFAGSATPLRVSISRTAEQEPIPPSDRISRQELTYLLAAGYYAAGDFGSAIKQVRAIPADGTSAALQFLLGQSLGATSPTSSEYATAWYKLRGLVPSAISADAALARMALAKKDFQLANSLADRVLAVRPSDPDALETITEATKLSTVENGTATQSNWWTARLAEHPSCAAIKSALGFYRSHGELAEARLVEQRLNGCAPESLEYAHSLASDGRQAEAAQALQTLLAAAPLNRAARLVLVRELQLSGQDLAAQQAAVEWLRVSPNAENYHRLASASPESDSVAPTTCFYSPYRRDAADVISAATNTVAAQGAAILLDDHVAISRPDGSASLYVHTARRVAAPEETALSLPRQVQVLTFRILHPDGTATALSQWPGSAAVLSPGDTLDEEYVLHYAGDGGIPEHAEAFQFVFGDFSEPVLQARFVILTPAARADRGVVITTGAAPRMTSRVRQGMLERVWEKATASPADDAAQEVPSEGSAIIRLVEQENGWTVPSKAEHQKRIETIHPGPRPEDT